MKNNRTDYGYFRVAAAVPGVNVADVTANVAAIVKQIDEAWNNGVKLLVMPELCITGYTCADLLGNDALLDAAERAIMILAEHMRQRDMMVIVGAPLRHAGHLFNCAIAIHDGRICVVPKTYIPNYKEFYEKRWFASANHVRGQQSIVVGGEEVPFGPDLIFDMGAARIAIEICEDLWVPVPPSSIAAINGANVIVNLSASNEVVGKHSYLVDLIRHQSDHSIAAYLYASAGYGESTTDLVFAGNAIIAENGVIMREGKRFTTTPQQILADIDLEALENERRINGSFADSLLQHKRNYRHIAFATSPANYSEMKLERTLRPLPFVPTNDAQLSARCEEIVSIQSMGLMRRMDFVGIKKLVIGISGGLDSTLALMIAVRAMDGLNLDRSGIIGITMPGFGTSGRTHKNALKLMEALGVTSLEISIAAAVEQHFADIGHDKSVQDVTYENSQARERTQILMDYANKVNALVLGTGDLSELALGWATYNGDHMSMYNVNGSIPKTLAKHLVMWFATEAMEHSHSPISLTIHETLLDVLQTPISPELTPADEQGNIKQVTEDIVGPYELHDFFLYNMLRHGYGPSKLHFMACRAFSGKYSSITIKQWLTVFMRRFFSQQFKRSCLPDGPKVGNVSLSPRGDWRMPSDTCSALWIKECNELPE